MLNLQGYTYEKNDISHEKLNAFFESFKAGSFDGINITIPHKEHGLQFVDELDDKAEALGNINCIKKTGEHLKGYNTDLYGFQMMLSCNNIDVTSSRCLVLGAGGSSKTIIKALSDGKAGSITVKNKSIENIYNELKKNLTKYKKTNNKEYCSLKLSELNVEFYEKNALTVVLASEGYPASSKTNRVIGGLEKQLENTKIQLNALYKKASKNNGFFTPTLLNF